MPEELNTSPKIFYDPNGKPVLVETYTLIDGEGLLVSNYTRNSDGRFIVAYAGDGRDITGFGVYIARDDIATLVDGFNLAEVLEASNMAAVRRLIHDVKVRNILNEEQDTPTLLRLEDLLKESQPTR
jgi:hypothetical protein